MNARINQPSRDRRSPETGIGLVDVLLVVTILGILASAATLSLNTTQLSLDAAVRAIVADANRAQQLAIHSRQAVGLRFDLATNGYRFILADGQTPIQAETQLRTTGGLTFVELERLLDARTDGNPTISGATLTAVSFDGSQDLLFDPDGSPQENGTIDLQGGETTLRIRVGARSGRMVVTQR